MTDIANYSTDSLKKKHYIRNYEKKQKDGMTTITYKIGHPITPIIIYFLAVLLLFLYFTFFSNIGFTKLTLIYTFICIFIVLTIVRYVENFFFAYTHYFDETGNLLGERKNGAAEAANKKGLDYCKQKKFTKAKKWFNNAYRTCWFYYYRKNTFKNNREGAAIADEAEQSLNKVDLTEVIRKFQEAHDKSNDKEFRSVLTDVKKKIDDRLTNESAEAVYKDGLDFYKECKFTEAYNCFEQAYQTCTTDYDNRITFREYRDAAKCGYEAEKALSQGNPVEAYIKAVEANDKAKSEIVCFVLSAGIKKLSDYKNDAAKLLNKRGLDFCKHSKFRESHKSFRLGSLICKSRSLKNNEYALQIACQAQSALSKNNLVEASRKFQEAHDKSDVQEIRSVFLKEKRKILERINNEAAERAYKEGLDFCKQQKFKTAYNHFYRASQTCTRDYINRSKFGNTTNATKIACEAQHSLIKRDPEEAINKFEEAYNKSKVEEIRSIFCSEKEKIEDRLKNEASEASYKEGLKFCKQGKFSKAYSCFNHAYETCASNYTSKDNFKNYKEAAKLAYEAQSASNKGHLDEAVKKFQEAYEKSQIQMLRSIFSIEKQNSSNQLNNETAETVHKKGMDFYRQHKFEEAYNCFNDAYQTCTGNYNNKFTFRNNSDTAKIACEAQSALKNKNLLEAEKKFQEAYDKSELQEVRLVLSKEIQKIHDQMKNDTAEVAYKKGLDFCKDHKFDKAYEYFNQAYHTCTSGFKRFGSSRDAVEIASEAQAAFLKRRLTQATKKFQEAYEKATDENVRTIFSTKKQKICDQIKNKAAEEMNKKAVDFCKEHKFDEAYKCFKQAYQTCTEEYGSKTTFKKATEAIEIAQEAEVALKNDDFEEAARKFQKAHDISEVRELSSILSTELEKISPRINEAAEQIYKKGLNLCEEHKFDEAYNSFIEAYHTCTRKCVNKSTFENAMDTLQIFLEAQSFLDLKEVNVAGAIKKFQEAYDKSKIGEIRSVFKTELENISSRTKEEVEDSNKKGLELCKQQKFAEAYNYLKKAYKMCESDTLRDTKDALEIACKALSSLNGGDFKEAARQFQEAHDKSNIEDVRSVFSKEIKKCYEHMKDEAETAYQEGLVFCKERKFDKAYNYFERANQLYINRIYKDSKDATQIACEAQDALNTGDFVEAYLGFEEAYNVSKEQKIILRVLFFEEKEKLSRFRDGAAEVAYKKGLDLCKQSKFDRACRYLKQASRMNSSSTFKNDADCTQIACEAQVALNVGNLEEAVKKIQEACDKSGITEILRSALFFEKEKILDLQSQDIDKEVVKHDGQSSATDNGETKLGNTSTKQTKPKPPFYFEKEKILDLRKQDIDKEVVKHDDQSSTTDSGETKLGNTSTKQPKPQPKPKPKPRPAK